MNISKGKEANLFAECMKADDENIRGPFCSCNVLFGKSKPLGIYLEETTIRKDPCTPTFTAALFTIAKTWKQSINGEMDKEDVVHMYVYTMEYY